MAEVMSIALKIIFQSNQYMFEYEKIFFSHGGNHVNSSKNHFPVKSICLNMKKIFFSHGGSHVSSSKTHFPVKSICLNTKQFFFSTGGSQVNSSKNHFPVKSICLNMKKFFFPMVEIMSIALKLIFESNQVMFEYENIFFFQWWKSCQ